MNLRSDVYSGFTIGATALLVVASKDLPWVISLFIYTLVLNSK